MGSRPIDTSSVTARGSHVNNQSRVAPWGYDQRRTQIPSEPRRGRRRSSPTHTSMRASRSPPSRDIIGSPSAGGPRTLPRSSLTDRLHGRALCRPNPKTALISAICNCSCCPEREHAHASMCPGSDCLPGRRPRPGDRREI